MAELFFSVFNHGPVAIQQMQTLLKEFERQERIHVHLDVIDWDVAWPRLVEFALYHHGPDVSEVGNTWIMDLVHMNALAPFGNDEIHAITEGKRFFEPSWRSCLTTDVNGRTVWALPWTGDVRVVYYRRDLLKQAGVDEDGAFATPQAFDQTLQCIKQSGVVTPLAMHTKFSRIGLQNLAAWVWALGGDFISHDAR